MMLNSMTDGSEKSKVEYFKNLFSSIGKQTGIKLDYNKIVDKDFLIGG